MFAYVVERRQDREGHPHLRPCPYNWKYAHVLDITTDVGPIRAPTPEGLAPLRQRALECADGYPLRVLDEDTGMEVG